MKRTAVKSSNIKAVGYDSTSRTLEVEFTSSSVYQYIGVEPEVASEFLEAKSVGSYFARNIKNEYEYNKL